MILNILGARRPRAHVLAVTGALGLVIAAATPASATILVNFTVNGDQFTPGVVTGQLSFASAGSGVAATSATVFTSSNPQVPVGAALDGAQLANSFDLSADGVVSSAVMFFYDRQYATYLSFNWVGFNAYGYNGQRIQNSTGFTGTTFTPVAAVDAAVPEPAAWGLMLLGFGAMGYSLRRKSKPAARIRFV